jgi:tetratricopeptide (TPR) repeat protein
MRGQFNLAGSRWLKALQVVLVAVCTTGGLGPLFAQVADRVITTDGSLTGRVVSTSPNNVDIEDRDGQTKTVSIERIREVQFGGEPPALRSARSMLARGRAADALEEIGQIDPAELDGAEQFLLDDVAFVKTAAVARVALATGADPRDAERQVADFLAKHPKSHHVYDIHELHGDLLARAGRPEQALAAYSQLSAGPAAMKVRAASARAGMLFNQKKFEEAIREYEAALKIETGDTAGAAQRAAAELGKARCLSQMGRNDAAIDLVRTIIKRTDPEEKEFLSRVYTVLGGAYRAAGDKDQDALISYLTVDLVYNSFPETHAEALYNLGELWDKVSNPERAREARKVLEEGYPASTWAKKAAG